VSGGGTVLLRAQQVLQDGLGLSGDELTGVRIVEKALEEPIKQICAMLARRAR
jgi:chaperonin GroEL